MLMGIEKPETYETPGLAQEINRQLVAVQKRLGELNPRWEHEAMKLASLE